MARVQPPISQPAEEKKMTFSDNPYARASQVEASPTSPDSVQHLDMIRNELRQEPMEKPQFYGVDIGIAKIGFTSDGAFNPGIDLGIVAAQAKVGLVNGGDASVNLGPIARAKAGAYAGVDRNGIYANSEVGAEALSVAGGRVDFDSRLGNATGADLSTQAYVGPLHAAVGGGAALAPGGLDSSASAHVRAGRLAGVHGGGHFAVNNRDSQLAAATGADLGDAGADIGAGVFSDGNRTARPDIYLRGRSGQRHSEAHLIPPLSIDEQAGDRGIAPQAQAEQIYRQPIDVRPLPPVYEAATPENVARVERESRTQLCQQFSYTVEKGDTYNSIAAKLMPGADENALAQEANKLREMHSGNGYHSLKAGQSLATADPYAIDRMTRQTVARHFGWPTREA